MLPQIDGLYLQFFALSRKRGILMQLYARSFIILRSVSHRKYLSTIGDISTRTKWLVSKRYIQAIIVITLMTLAIAVPFLTRAFAVTDVRNAGVFEMDGNIVKNSGGTLPTDWGALFDANGNTQTLPSGGLDAHWVNDGPHAVTDLTTFTTGSKDTLDIANAGWQCTPSGNITPKDDILHSYSFAIVAPPSSSVPGDLLVYGGFERFANNGAGDLGLWLLQDPTVACSSTKGAVSFTGAHVVGDILIVGEFSTGGSVTTLNEFKWVGISRATPTGLMNITSTGAADCTVAPPTANICARSNTGPISTLPWSTQDKTSIPNMLATAEFFEVGIDLTGLFGSNAPCINRFIFDTRTSPSLTATLVDYAQGALVTCPTPSISTTVSPSTITLGGSATDTATVGLTAGTVNGTVDFKVYGPFAANTPICTGTPIASFLGVAIGPGPSPQTATSGSFMPSAPGYYFWTATYNPAGPRNGNTISTPCGDTNETLLVIATTISTTVSSSTITFGGSVTDTATVTLNPSSAIVSGTVDFFVYGPVSTNNPTCTTLVQSFIGVSIGPTAGSATATSGSFMPSAPGYYFWTATYNPAGVANGSTKSTTCGDTGETLLVSSIPKITAFSFTNTPDNNDPTRASGTVTYSFTIHNYGTSTVTLSGALTVDGTALTTCGTLTPSLSGYSLAASADATFSLTCTYSGMSGQTVSASINANFTDQNNVTGAVSGSPTTYIFTIQKL